MSRLAVALAVLALSGAPSPSPAAAAAPAPAPAKTYVLVHGAWGGGWAWRDVGERLAREGHRVHRPTLTGLGERVHLMRPDVGLSTHVDDVVNVLLYEDLRGVILLGHSYGGMVISGVAERVPERIAQLVYLDALLAEDGESWMTLLGRPPLPPEMLAEHTRRGVMVPPWLEGKALEIPGDVPHPAQTFVEPLSLKNPAARGLRATYILTLDPGTTEDKDFGPFAERAKKRGYKVLTMEADHNPWRTAPEALARLLLGIE